MIQKNQTFMNRSTRFMIRFLGIDFEAQIKILLTKIL